MGAGGSVPDRLNLEACRNLAGLKFDQHTFDRLCDGEGYVTRSQLLRVAERSRALEAVARDGAALKGLERHLRGDLEVVLAAVGSRGEALFHASADLRADRRVVRAAVGNHWRALGFASQELKADRDIVLAAIEQDGRALFYAAPALKADPVVLRAVDDSVERATG
jgi:hypothetical protein